MSIIRQLFMVNEIFHLSVRIVKTRIRSFRREIIFGIIYPFIVIYMLFY